MKKYKLLNAYCGIGGNRKFWDEPLQKIFGNNYEITAIENNPEIAKIYQDFFPNDKVIVADAHQFILEHFKEFDFIWSSPPCPTHSRTNLYLVHQGMKHRYPDMMLYQEILLFSYFFDGKFIVENVKSYYMPLVAPQVSGRHYFWANFKIPNLNYIQINVELMKGTKEERHDRKMKRNKSLNFDLSKIVNVDKNKCLNNCVDPKIGKIILEKALNIQKEESIPQGKLF